MQMGVTLNPNCMLMDVLYTLNSTKTLGDDVFAFFTKLQGYSHDRCKQRIYIWNFSFPSLEMDFRISHAYIKSIARVSASVKASNL